MRFLREPAAGGACCGALSWSPSASNSEASVYQISRLVLSASKLGLSTSPKGPKEPYNVAKLRRHPKPLTPTTPKPETHSCFVLLPSSGLFKRAVHMLLTSVLTVCRVGDMPKASVGAVFSHLLFHTFVALA